MQVIEIDVHPRQSSGSSACRRIRRDGFLPAIVYARGEQSVSAQVPTKAFVTAASRSRSSQIFTLKSEIAALNGRKALVKGIQREHLSGSVLHIDFQALRENEAIIVEIPIRLTGEAYGVKTEGGILSITAHQLSVSCLPRLIPEEVVLDISELKIGDSIHARELPLPEGVTLEVDGDETIVSVVAIRQVVEEAPAAAAAVKGAVAAPAGDAAAASPAATPEKEKK